MPDPTQKPGSQSQPNSPTKDDGKSGPTENKGNESKTNTDKDK